MEVEYKATIEVAKDIIWIKQLLQNIGQVQLAPKIFNCDNQSCIALYHAHKFHSCTKHIEIQYLYIHKVIKKEWYNYNIAILMRILLIFLQNPLPRTSINIVLLNLVSSLFNVSSLLLFIDSFQVSLYNVLSRLATFFHNQISKGNKRHF
jgi:hypothetical protein